MGSLIVALAIIWEFFILFAILITISETESYKKWDERDNRYIKKKFPESKF